MVQLRSLAAFLFALLGVQVFLIPIEAILIYAGLIPAVLFASAWVYLWIWLAVRYDFYTKHVVAYSIGYGIGIGVNLVYVLPYLQQNGLGF